MHTQLLAEFTVVVVCLAERFTPINTKPHARETVVVVCLAERFTPINTKPHARETVVVSCSAARLSPLTPSHALASGGVCPHGAVVADGDGNVFGVVGSADDAGRVGFHVDAHERLGGAVVALLELNDARTLIDAVNRHGRIEKNGGLHDGGFLFVVVFLVGGSSISR